MHVRYLCTNRVPLAGSSWHRSVFGSGRCNVAIGTKVNRWLASTLPTNQVFRCISCKVGLVVWPLLVDWYTNPARSSCTRCVFRHASGARGGRGSSDSRKVSGRWHTNANQIHALAFATNLHRNCTCDTDAQSTTFDIVVDYHLQSLGLDFVGNVGKIEIQRKIQRTLTLRILKIASSFVFDQQ
jgi:hypothetical protein